MEIGSCAAEPSRCHVRNRTDNFRVRKRDAPVRVLSMLYRIVYAVWILLMLYGYYLCCRVRQVGPYTDRTMGCAPIPAGAYGDGACMTHESCKLWRRGPRRLQGTASRQSPPKGHGFAPFRLIELHPIHP